MSPQGSKIIATATRLDELRTILENRRAGLLRDLQHRIREVRTDAATDRDGLDEAESAEVAVQDEIGFALLQLKAETLDKIEDALRRIEAGSYGDCASCGGEISEPRLRALPFARRCKDCEEDWEGAVLRARSLAQHSPMLLVERS
jgi:DnaK suppressor protein